MIRVLMQTYGSDSLQKLAIANLQKLFPFTTLSLFRQLRPKFWSDSKGATACKVGQEQSPININKITKVTASSATPPAISYSKTANARINDNGNTVKWNTVVYTAMTSADTITLEGSAMSLSSSTTIFLASINSQVKTKLPEREAFRSRQQRSSASW